MRRSKPATKYRLIIPQADEPDKGDIIAEISFHKTDKDPEVMYDSAVIPDSLPASLFDTYDQLLEPVDPNRKRRVVERYLLVIGNRRHTADPVVAEFTCKTKDGKTDIRHKLIPSTEQPEGLGVLTALHLIGKPYRKHEATK